ncbi:unnamed protein product [Paramecium sonneborni]|uniref:Rab-GAP TBC domain-containing protein n=1 Tax=Paramecium sonneborni TaxID=65129 RepID=A0A8S1QU18_9CILI|nr:unnamed protein product [Paramecium sonneborni]
MSESQNPKLCIDNILESLPFEIIQQSRRRNRNLQNIKDKNSKHQSKIFQRSISEDKEQIKNQSYKDQKNPAKSKDDQPLTQQEQFEYKLIQVEISDFVIIERCKNGHDIYLLQEEDWKKIISQKSFQGFNFLDIHVSLLKQNLFFQERRELWQFFCSVDVIQEKIEQTNKTFYQYSKLHNNFLEQIDKDIPRTLIGCEFLANQENTQSLRNILMAYANYDPDLGYTQGMNIIAGNLLVCFDLQSNDNQFLEGVEIYDPKRDELVFYIFIYIMIEQNWRSIFLPGFPGLIRMMNALESQFKTDLPQLYQHFQDLGIDLNICFQYQYLTLLMYGISWKISRMIFDIFFFEGEQIIHTFIIGMLKYCQDTLLKLQTFEDIVKFCRNDMILQFYGLFSIHLDGKKDLTNTLFNLGFIKQYGLIKENNLEVTKNINTNQNKQNDSGQINRIGKFIKQFFRKP